MQQLLIATTNKGKVQELRQFLSDLPVKLVSLADVGIVNDVEEDGETYEENSQKKALFYAEKSGLPAIADDGGLEIDALGGLPGIKSRRWVRDGSDEAIITHMRGIAKRLPKDNRNARFVTVVSFALPNGNVWSGKGTVDGIIAKRPLMKLLHGYPYRSFFFLPTIQKYYHESELPEEQMKKYNHRLQAIQKLMPVIVKHLRL